jgi:flagellar basal-body rod protein FlgF
MPRRHDTQGGVVLCVIPTMSYGLYISAEGAQAQSRRLETIANNLANVDTPGFKRDLAICQARFAEAVEQGLKAPGTGALDDIGGGVMVRQTKTDFSAGPLKHTKDPTNLAIEGDGFFQVRKGDETFLTRAGNFRLTNHGDLVTQQGHAVLSETGTPIVVKPDSGPWEISGAGALRQRDGDAQNLALVKPESLGDLVKVGENLFRSPTEARPIAANERKVVTGYLELSTVQPTVEMTAMIEASRLVEANVNLMKTQDQMLGNLIGRVLRA